MVLHLFVELYVTFRVIRVENPGMIIPDMEACSVEPIDRRIDEVG